MKTYKQRTESILQKTKQKKKKRAIAASIGGACMSVAITALAFVLFLPYPTNIPSVSQYRNSEYYSVIKKLNEITYGLPMYKNNFEKWTAELGETFGGVDGVAPPTSIEGTWPENDATQRPSSPGLDGVGGALESVGGGSATNQNKPNNYEETTDNQVEGVIEGDRLKRTKTHFFYYDDTYTLRVYEIAGEATSQTCAYPVAFTYRDVEMYLSEDGERLCLVGSNWNYDEGYTTTIVTLDVSDPANVVELEKAYLSGKNVSSRLVDGKLLVVNNFQGICTDFSKQERYIPQYGTEGNKQFVAAEDIVCPENANSTHYTVVCEIDLATGEAVDCMALLSYSGQVYVSAENLFLTRSYTETFLMKWENKTEISQISYSGEGLECVGSMNIAGTVRNQYSLDEYEGMLRVVTTTWEGNVGDSSRATKINANLYCIDLKNYQIVGKVEAFAPEGEEVCSVRFDKEKAYVCTAVVIQFTDPVYAFDLSDPKNITYTDTGIIGGYSSNLVQFKDGTLLGIGRGVGGDLKIELYKETEEKLESVAVYENKRVLFSEEYKSYFIDRERGLIGLGVTNFHINTSEPSLNGIKNGYLLLRFDGYELTEVLFEEWDINNTSGFYLESNDLKRAALVDGYFYIFSRDLCRAVYIGE